jgi:hypothetical protein
MCTEPGCEWAFTQKIDLKRHMNAVHSKHLEPTVPRTSQPMMNMSSDASGMMLMHSLSGADMTPIPMQMPGMVGGNVVLATTLGYETGTHASTSMSMGDVGVTIASSAAAPTTLGLGPGMASVAGLTSGIAGGITGLQASMPPGLGSGMEHLHTSSDLTPAGSVAVVVQGGDSGSYTIGYAPASDTAVVTTADAQFSNPQLGASIGVEPTVTMTHPMSLMTGTATMVPMDAASVTAAVDAPVYVTTAMGDPTIPTIPKLDSNQLV